MKSVNISIDKIAVEYHGVSVAFYNKLAVSFYDWYNIKPAIRHKGYVYHWNLSNGDAYMHLCYQPWWQRKARKYNLRIETHPAHLDKFQNLLTALRNHTQNVSFIRCEVAFDFPYPTSNVFIASKTGRNMNIYEGTRYFGRKDQRKQHAYCRNYDKKVERKRKGVEELGERTRVELVYRPDEKIDLETIIQYPPTFNEYYSCSVITDLQEVRVEKRAMILALQHGLMTSNELSKHHRATINEIMSLQQPVDFDNLVAHQWAELVTVPCVLICGKVNRGATTEQVS